jgi:hypothetical protein
MDPHTRIVYKAFRVPDVLTEENQRKAAAIALLLSEKTELRPNWLDGAMSGGQRTLYLQVAGIVVDALVSELEEHGLDEHIGRYGSESEALDRVNNRVFRAETGSLLSQFPNEAVEWMVTTGLKTLVNWVRENPDALRDFRHELS